jgi:hypothetical protein
MAIKFACASCGKELTAKVEHAGKRARCSACGEVTRVPSQPTWEADDSPPVPPPLMQFRAEKAEVESPTHEPKPYRPTPPDDVEKRRPFWKSPIVIITAANGLMLTANVLILIVQFGYLGRHPVQTTANRNGAGTQSVVTPKESNPTGPERRLLANGQRPSPTTNRNPAKDRPAHADDTTKSQIIGRPTTASTEDPFPVFQIGDEAIIHIDKSDIQKNPKLERSGVLTIDSIVLMREYGQDRMEQYERARISGELSRGIAAGDADGIDELIKNGDLVRIRVGTRVRVIQAFSLEKSVFGYNLFSAIEPDHRGLATVRITKGDSKGKAVHITPRNLRRISTRVQ